MRRALAVAAMICAAPAAAVVPGGGVDLSLGEGLNRPLQETAAEPMGAIRSFTDRRAAVAAARKRLAPLGWDASSYALGRWTIYVLEHKDGTRWESHFYHRLQNQLRRLNDPAWLQVDGDTDALLLKHHAKLAAEGWAARYLYEAATVPPGQVDFPVLSWQLRRAVPSAGSLLRKTGFESEFRYWLENGGGSCWGADRPFPNCL